MTTSAESIPFNIVEGCGANSPKELARFLDISIKSTMELEYQLKLASDYGIVDEAEELALTEEVVDTRRMLCGLRGEGVGRWLSCQFVCQARRSGADAVWLA